MSYKIVSDNELYHWGIVGMRWGIRRYQNEDGTLTEAGKKRYGDFTDEERQNYAKKSALIDAQANREAKIYDQASQIGQKGKTITDESARLIDRFGTKTYKVGPDASTMTDEELRQRINRLNMERQYDQLTTYKETSKGAQVTKDILEVAGSALVIGGSVAAIMANMKRIAG